LLCWDGRGDEWLLAEDQETTERSRVDDASVRRLKRRLLGR
jgi:hypothetical protein